VFIHLQQNLCWGKLTRANTVVVHGAHWLLMQDEHIGDTINSQKKIS